MGIVFHPMTLVVLFSCKKNKTLAATIQIKKNIIPCKKARKPPTNSCDPLLGLFIITKLLKTLEARDTPETRVFGAIFLPKKSRSTLEHLHHFTDIHPSQLVALLNQQIVREHNLLNDLRE